MALVVAGSVGDVLRRTALDSAVHNVEAIVRGYVDPCWVRPVSTATRPATPRSMPSSSV
jgi:hypothetical protein